MKKTKEEQIAVKFMKEIGMDNEEIDDKLHVSRLLKGYKKITFQELLGMTEDKQNELLSLCWHDGNYRCSCVGISEVKFENDGIDFILTYSDENGDPEICFHNFKDEIHRFGDGEWDYGLYKKEENEKR